MVARLTGPEVMLPIEKVTVPTVTRLPWDVTTVASNVTVWPKIEGFGNETTVVTVPVRTIRSSRASTRGITCRGRLPPGRPSWPFFDRLASVNRRPKRVGTLAHNASNQELIDIIFISRGESADLRLSDLERLTVWLHALEVLAHRTPPTVAPLRPPPS